MAFCFALIGSGSVGDNLELLRCINALQDLIDVRENRVFDQILGAVSALQNREPFKDHVDRGHIDAPSMVGS